MDRGLQRRELQIELQRIYPTDDSDLMGHYQAPSGPSVMDFPNSADQTNPDTTRDCIDLQADLEVGGQSDQAQEQVQDE